MFDSPDQKQSSRTELHLFIDILTGNPLTLCNLMDLPIHIYTIQCKYGTVNCAQKGVTVGIL